MVVGNGRAAQQNKMAQCCAFLADTKERLGRRAFARRTHEQLLQDAGAAPQLAKCLGRVDLVLLGVGSIVGAGVFVLTGVAAREHAGPAVIASYLVAAGAALLAGLCYTEFAVDLPISGGAFNCIYLTFGEVTAWVVACNLIMEYTLSAAAVARGFSAYLATLWGLSPQALLVHAGPVKLDFLAVALIALLALLLSWGTKHSARFNAVVTGTNLIVIAYIICAGAPFGDVANLTPFAPWGLRGVFAAASLVFFSYVGFDTIATAAEEVEDPSVDLPWGIVGAILISAALYGGLACVLCTMVPYAAISVDAPYSSAFEAAAARQGGFWTATFLRTSGRFVSFGAVTGIIATLLLAVLGQARIYVTLARERLLPAWLAELHPTRGTPANATIATAVTSSVLALLVDLEALAELVSIGTLFVFGCVAAGVLWRRYHSPLARNGRWVGGWLGAVVLASLALSLTYGLGAPGWAVALPAAAWLGAVAALAALPVSWRAPRFRCPLQPVVPALAVLATIHLISSLGPAAYIRFGAWLAVSLAVYCGYSVHSADRHERYGAAAAVNARDSGEGLWLARGPRSDGGPPGGPDVELAAAAKGAVHPAPDDHPDDNSSAWHGSPAHTPTAALLSLASVTAGMRDLFRGEGGGAGGGGGAAPPGGEAEPPEGERLQLHALEEPPEGETVPLTSAAQGLPPKGTSSSSLEKDSHLYPGNPFFDREEESNPFYARARERSALERGAGLSVRVAPRGLAPRGLAPRDLAPRGLGSGRGDRGGGGGEGGGVEFRPVAVAASEEDSEGEGTPRAFQHHQPGAALRFAGGARPAVQQYEPPGDPAGDLGGDAFASAEPLGAGGRGQVVSIGSVLPDRVPPAGGGDGGGSRDLDDPYLDEGGSSFLDPGPHGSGDSPVRRRGSPFGTAPALPGEEREGEGLGRHERGRHERGAGEEQEGSQPADTSNPFELAQSLPGEDLDHRQWRSSSFSKSERALREAAKLDYLLTSEAEGSRTLQRKREKVSGGLRGASRLRVLEEMLAADRERQAEAAAEEAVRAAALPPLRAPAGSRAAAQAAGPDPSEPRGVPQLLAPPGGGPQRRAVPQPSNGGKPLGGGGAPARPRPGGLLTAAEALRAGAAEGGPRAAPAVPALQQGPSARGRQSWSESRRDPAAARAAAAAPALAPRLQRPPELLPRPFGVQGMMANLE